MNRDLQSRIAHDICDYMDLIERKANEGLANALRAPSLSSASPIEPEEVSTEGFNRLSQSSRERGGSNVPASDK